MDFKKNIPIYKKNSATVDRFKIPNLFYSLILLSFLMFLPIFTLDVNAEVYSKSKLDIPILDSFINHDEDKFFYYMHDDHLVSLYINSADDVYLMEGDGETSNSNERKVYEKGKYYLTSTTSDFTYYWTARCYVEDEWQFYHMHTFIEIDYEKLLESRLYYSNFDLTLNGEIVLPSTNNLPDEILPEEPPISDSEPPSTIENGNVIINGEEVSYDYAIVQLLIRIEFMLNLLLTVTVVFFVINKFWAWCRRLFTVSC